ncbi:MAG: hypothetical protein V1672_05830 [Candidatus Diapherotrites archaeon]
MDIKNLMKNKKNLYIAAGGAVILILAIYFLFFFGRVSPAAVADKFGALDDTSLKIPIVIDEIEKIKNLNLENRSPREIAETMYEGEAETFVEDGVEGAEIDGLNAKIMVLKFENAASAAKYMTGLEASFVVNGGDFGARLDYEDICNVFISPAGGDVILLLQKDSVLILMEGGTINEEITKQNIEEIGMTQEELEDYI